MAEARQSAALVVGPGGGPEGIVTDSDLRTKVVAAGAALDGPVSTIMSRPVVTMDEQAHCFEAVLRKLNITQRHIEHETNT